MVKIVKSNKPIYSIGIAWILYASFFPMYKTIHFLIAFLVSFVVFVLVSLKYPNRQITSVPENEPIETGNTEADRILNEGREYLKQIRNTKYKINHSEVLKQITSLEDITERIFAIIAENPEKIVDTKIFMSYYLPTTVKLIDTYQEFESEKNIGGKNIKNTLEKIESDLYKIVESFRNLLDSMYSEQAIDISTDITVMQGMLEQQGYLSTNALSELKSKQKENKNNE